MLNRKKKKVENLTLEASQRLDAGDPQTAHMLLTEAMSLDPDSGSAWLVMGQILESAGQQKEAFEAYKKAGALDPTQAPQAYFKLAGMLDRAGDWQRSVEVYSSVIQLAPEMGAAWTNLGRALDELGNYQEAMKAYDRAMHLMPEDTNLLSNLANTFRKMHRYQESIEICNRALAIDPRLTHVQEMLHFAQRALGLIEEEQKPEAVDPVGDRATEDPAMQVAAAEARRTLPHFMQILANPESGASYFLLAIFRDRPDSQVEYLWLASPSFQNGQWSGQVMSEPKVIISLAIHDFVEVELDQIRDWMVKRGDQMEGGYTTRVLMGS